MAASYKPVALYGLQVQANDEPLHVFEGSEFPATIRLTMAALDPTSPAEDGVDADTPARATLKMIRIRDDSEDGDSEDDDDDDDDDGIGMEDLLDESSDDDDEVNGGPSDPSKAPKARRKAAIEKLRKAIAEGATDGMDVDGSPKDKKGKARAAVEADEELDDDDDDDDDDSDEDDDIDAEEFVLCTLDPLKNYQQPLDVVINEHETVLFQVIGTHNIHLTGNILLPEDDENDMAGYPGLDGEDDELDYSDEDELDMIDGLSDESDELDDMDDPRIAEIDSDEEEVAPKLIAAKGKNKRAAEEDSELGPAAVNGAAEEPPLSKNQLKKQRKKMRDNNGNPVEVAAATTPNGVKVEATRETPDSKEKKSVAFAKNLVQGPSNGAATAAAANTTAAKPASGPRVVQGVTVDDKKIGSGAAAKKGDRVSMRYIGKLEANTKKIFDSNKKGAPFTFKLGSGQVIKGWDIGVAGMQVGGERRITIPAHLGYGAAGAPPDIPKNAGLVFDLKVLEIKK